MKKKSVQKTGAHHNSLVEGEYSFKGKHFIASYLDCDEIAIRNIEVLKKQFQEAVKASYATILEVAEFVFAPDGLTMVLLLSESHASIHTYPERRACFVDLFTCGEKCQSSAFDTILRNCLKPAKVSWCELLRSDRIEAVPFVQ
ncbi:MAG: adenosylmethionine decarboxylase [Simkania sp.]|nr:adenosylmethionine decarboxylase [Simkania sp.]